MSDFVIPQKSAIFYLERISKKELDPKRLTKHQRRLCVRYLLVEQKHTQSEIASILQVVDSVITNDKRKIMEQNVWLVDNIDERQVAIDLVIAANTATARLFRKGKEKEALEVKVKAIDALQSLGYLKRAPIEFQGRLTMEEILKLANGPEDENFLSEGTGRGSEKVITNGSH